MIPYGACTLDKATLYPDLEWIENKASYKQVFQLFYTLAQCRYATFKQLHPLNHRVITKNNLVRFIESGYLSTIELVNNQKAFYITEKTRDILTREGFNTKILQKKFTGQVLEHELLITDAILKLQPWIVFYPQFKEPPDYCNDWLKPDACLIFKNDTGFKIQFLEVEEPKQDWENYLLIKREKYERLANDASLFFYWWKHKSKKLNLSFGSVEEFCFSILCISKLKYEWEGWEFV